MDCDATARSTESPARTLTTARSAGARSDDEGGAPQQLRTAPGRPEAGRLDPVEKSYAAERVAALEDALAAVGVTVGCERPLVMVDKDGQTVTVRCGSRRSSQCVSCSALYKGDAAALLRSGALDESGVVVHLTLTAPSFGKVHRVPKPPSPRLSDRACVAWGKRAARRCPCGSTHPPGDELAGVPLDTASYDFEGQVRWNRATGRLWNRTATNLTRTLALPERIAYCGVAEGQVRGAVHHHTLVRLPSLAALGPYVDASGRSRSRVIENVVRASTTIEDGESFSWGNQVVAEIIVGDPRRNDAGRHARRAVGYLAKVLTYAIKDLAADENVDQAAHLRRLDRTARWLPCTACPPGGPTRCTSRRHGNLGYGGWPVRRSRSFTALSFGVLRERRRQWMARPSGEGVDGQRSWRLAGRGAAPPLLEATWSALDRARIELRMEWST